MLFASILCTCFIIIVAPDPSTSLLLWRNMVNPRWTEVQLMYLFLLFCLKKTFFPNHHACSPPCMEAWKQTQYYYFLLRDSVLIFANRQSDHSGSIFPFRSSLTWRRWKASFSTCVRACVSQPNSWVLLLKQSVLECKSPMKYATSNSYATICISAVAAKAPIRPLPPSSFPSFSLCFLHHSPLSHINRCFSSCVVDRTSAWALLLSAASCCSLPSGPNCLLSSSTQSQGQVTQCCRCVWIKVMQQQKKKMLPSWAVFGSGRLLSLQCAY